MSHPAVSPFLHGRRFDSVTTTSTAGLNVKYQCTFTPLTDGVKGAIDAFARTLQSSFVKNKLISSTKSILHLNFMLLSWKSLLVRNQCAGIDIELHGDLGFSFT